MAQTRYCECLYNDDAWGRFSGKKPKQAANKAFLSILIKYFKKTYDGEKIIYTKTACTSIKHIS